MKRCISAVAGMAMVLACGLAGPVMAAEAVLTLDNFRERVTKEVPVSGRMLVGAAVMGAAGARAVPSPRLLWPGPSAAAAGQGLCVTFSSRDGIFNSDGEIPPARLAGVSGAPSIQGARSREAMSHLEGLPRDDLAVLATRGACTVGETDADLTQVTLLDRRESATGDAVLQLAINPQGYAVAVDLVLQGNVRLPATCVRLDDSRRNKSFSLQCTLALPLNASEAQVVIQRRKNERVFADRVYRLSWARP